MKPQPISHLRLVPAEKPTGFRPGSVLLIVGVVIYFGLLYADWRVAPLKRQIEELDRQSPRLRTVTIECVTWQGRPFELTVAIPRGEADRVVDALEQTVEPPYNPTCMARGFDKPEPED